MSSSSKNSPSSKTSSSSDFSPEVAAEIARLMRDSNSLQSEADQFRRSLGRGHYDPNQPRVPAGDPRGGQFASKGYRGGGSGRDVRTMQTSLDATRFAELGAGNPASANAPTMPFDGQLGEISPAQHLTSQNGFLQAERDRRTNPRTQVIPFEAGVGGPNNSGRYEFLATGGLSVTNGLRGPQAVVTSTTYVHDRLTGAYATIRATQGAIVYEQKTPSAFGPAHRSSRLFSENDDCAAVKLDVWINRGFLTYSLFGDPDPRAAPAESTDESGKTTMLIGGKNCQVRIVIERSDGRSGGK